MTWNSISVMLITALPLCIRFLKHRVWQITAHCTLADSSKLSSDEKKTWLHNLWTRKHTDITTLMKTNENVDALWHWVGWIVSPVEIFDMMHEFIHVFLSSIHYSLLLSQICLQRDLPTLHCQPIPFFFFSWQIGYCCQARIAFFHTWSRPHSNHILNVKRIKCLAIWLTSKHSHQIFMLI